MALKFLSKEGRTSDDVTSLKREVEILRSLKHPHVIQLLDSFETDEEVCVVTGV